MSAIHPGSLSAQEPERIVKTLGKAPYHVLLFGETGIGKSTLTTELARVMEKAGHACGMPISRMQKRWALTFPGSIY